MKIKDLLKTKILIPPSEFNNCEDIVDKVVIEDIAKKVREDFEKNPPKTDDEDCEDCAIGELICQIINSENNLAAMEPGSFLSLIHDHPNKDFLLFSLKQNQLPPKEVDDKIKEIQKFAETQENAKNK